MPKRLISLIIVIAVLSAGCRSALSEPSLIYLVSQNGLVDGFQSSYCWESGIGEGICKDTVAPYFESSTSLDASAPIRFQLDTPLPETVTLSISKDVFGESIFSGTMLASEVIDWSPAVPPGEYIVVVHATWKQGVVSYWFSVSLE